MDSPSQDKYPRGPTGVPEGSGRGPKGTGKAAEGGKGSPHLMGGNSPWVPPASMEKGETVSAARANPHYGEDVDDKIVGTGCSEEYAKLQDCLDETDK